MFREPDMATFVHIVDGAALKGMRVGRIRKGEGVRVRLAWYGRGTEVKLPSAQDQFIDGGIKIRLRILVDGANKIFYCIFDKGGALVARTRNVPRVFAG